MHENFAVFLKKVRSEDGWNGSREKETHAVISVILTCRASFCSHYKFLNTLCHELEIIIVKVKTPQAI